MSKKQKFTTIGGQALMEGIMMRGPYKTVMAVRRADGTIELEDVKQNDKKSVWSKIPIIRGVYAFIDAMVVGTKTLMRSAEIAIQDEVESAEAQEKTAQDAAEAPAESAGTADGAPEDTDQAAQTADAENEAPAVDAATDGCDAAPEAAPACEQSAPVEEEAADDKAADSTAPTEAIEESKAAAEKKSAKKDKKAGKKADKKSDKKGSSDDSGFLTIISTVLGFGLAILLFFYAPTWIAGGLFDWLFPRVLPEKWAQYLADPAVQQVWRPIIEGICKLIIFIAYLLFCTTMKEIRTVFMYHGAEHKTIFCYEAGEELTVENVRKFKRFHPRCGTSFLILMLIIGVVAGIFVKSSSLPDAVKNSPVFYPLIKIALIPIIMGVGYELLKFAGKHDNIITRIISAPGLWVQRITTREPDDAQIECAIAALKPVIPDDGADMK